MSQICLNKIFFIIIIFVLVLIIYFFIFNIKQYINHYDFIKKKLIEIDNNNKLINDSINKSTNKLTNLNIDSNLYSNINIRDRQILYDPLYPPLNRDPVFIKNDYINIKSNLSNQILQNKNLSNQLISYPTRDSNDTFHLIANLTRIDPDDKLQLLLFGRLKCRGCKSEFYASPVDINFSSIKIPIDKLNDIYNIPNEIIINDVYPGTFKVFELKYHDLSSNYY